VIGTGGRDSDLIGAVIANEPAETGRAADFPPDLAIAPG
jgi:hypothetical protein